MSVGDVTTFKNTFHSQKIEQSCTLCSTNVYCSGTLQYHFLIVRFCNLWKYPELPKCTIHKVIIGQKFKKSAYYPFDLAFVRVWRGWAGCPSYCSSVCVTLDVNRSHIVDRAANRTCCGGAEQGWIPSPVSSPSTPQTTFNGGEQLEAPCQGLTLVLGK